MADDAPRDSKGQFAEGAGWTSEQARAAALKSHAPGVRRMTPDKLEEEINKLISEAGVDPDKAPATLRTLAKNAIKGASSDMKLWLTQTGQLQQANEKYDGKGPCPTCGQTPGEGLSIRQGQVESIAKTLKRLEALVTESEKMVQREHGIDLHPVPFQQEATS